MDLLVDLDGPGDRVSRIYQHLLDGIASGRLPPGERLPATRALAQELGVARGTVATAYDRLASEGYLETRVGAGTFVSGEVGPPRAAAAPAGDLRPRAVWEELPAAVPDAPPLPFDLSVAGPDTTLFPFAVWRRLVSATLRPALQQQPVYDGSGHPQLQAEIARHLRVSRSVVTDRSDVLLTGGAQQALDLIGKVMLAPGDVVAIEDPGYTAVLRLYSAHGATVRGVPVDEEGMVVDALPDDARVVYVTPSHQFPTGAVMSLRRRTALLDWAETHRALVVEDDYDSEFRYGARALAPLQSLDRSGRVAYVGSFSKSLMPMLRIGYVVAPRSLQPALRDAKVLTDWQGDTVTQGAMARFLGEGLLAAHVRRATRVYAGRRTVLLRELSELDDVLEPFPSAAGLHVCTRLRDQQLSDQQVVAHLASLGVGVEPLSPRYVEQPAVQGLSLGFRRIDEQRIPAAVRRIGEVLHRV